MLGMWLYLFVALLGYNVYLWLKPWIRIIKMTSNLPGPPGTPIIGNIFQTDKNGGFLQLLASCYKKYGPIVRGWVTIVPVVLVLEPNDLQVIMGNSKVSDKNFLYNVLGNFSGVGLVTSKGDKWKSHRKYIQPYFNTNVLEKCIPTLVECSKVMVKSLENVTEIKITSTVHMYLLDALHELVFGIPVNDHVTKMNSPFVKSPNLALEAFLKPWLFIPFAIKGFFGKETTLQYAWKQFAAKALVRIKEQNERKLFKYNLLNFLQKVSDSVDDFQEEDVLNEACAFMLAGQDTIRTTLSFTLYYIAKHQDIQDKIMVELNQVFLYSEVINISSLNEMKYLEQCIKESMRLCPAVPLISRKLLEDVQLNNHVLPAGCSVFISPYATHRLPHYYPNPEVFDPDRFLEKTQDERHSFAYMPFSAGPRNCIGNKLAMLAMKTVISTLLKNYKISLAVGFEELDPVYRITLKSKQSIWLRLDSRKVVD